MEQIRDNIFRITLSELGSPKKKGDVKVEGLGTVMLDVADMHYAETMAGQGYEPVYFVSRSAVMGGRFVVVSRQHLG
jgi:hypothetical protein